MAMKWSRRARERDLRETDRWRTARRLVDDDVTSLGEELAELHIDTLASELDDETAHHYRRALEHYEQAKAALQASTTVDEVIAVDIVLADARYHRASVLALQAGEPLPPRREPCFFDPRHGPSTRDMPWAPPAGVVRTVAVCAADARRLEGGQAPDTRQVRIGDRWVPVHEAGGIEAVMQRHRDFANERSMSHNQKSRAEAHLNQSLGGIDGAGGAGGLFN